MAPDPALPSLAEIEALAASVDSGTLTFEEAEIEARRAFSRVPRREDVRKAGATNERRAQQAGDWRLALLWFRLFYAATDELDDNDREELRMEATVPYLGVAYAAIVAIPDGWVFNEAVRRGKTAEAHASATSRSAFIGEINHRLGVLHLDPFVLERSIHNFPNEDALWRRRVPDQYGQAGLSEDRQVPAALVALGTSMEFLEAALPHRREGWRGFTLKALCTAMKWTEYLSGVPADRKRLTSYAREAISLLPGEYRQELSILLEDEPSVLPGSNADDKVDIHRVMRELGPAAGYDRCRLSLKHLVRSDPISALAMIASLWLYLGESHPTQGLDLSRYFANACATLADQNGWALRPGETAQASVARLMDRARRDNWDEWTSAVALVGLGVTSQPQNREAEVVDYLVDFKLLGSSELASLVRLMAAQLLQGAGVNSFNARDGGAATVFYSRAADEYARVNYHELALGALDLALDAAKQGSDDGHAQLVVTLSAITSTLTAAGPTHLASRLRVLWENVMATVFQIGTKRQPINPELLILALQAAKGADLSSRMATPTTFDWRGDAELQKILAAIRDLGPVNIVPSSSSNGISDSLILTSYTSAVAGQIKGREGELRRLQIRFDSLLAARSAPSAGFLASALSCQEVRSLLGADTALLIQYLCRTTDGNFAAATLLMTDTELHFSVGKTDLPAAPLSLGQAGDTVEASWLALHISELREHIQEEPGPEVVVSEAMDTLRNGGVYLGGPDIEAKLAALRARGKTHLCIHPYDALHYHPQHLVQLGDRPLADDWTVTYVAHPSILRKRTSGERETAPKLPVSALALGYQDGQPHGQAPLGMATAEATEIARLFDGRLYLEAEATETNLLAALDQSKRVHVACHGKALASAPAFQSLYLQPDGTDDGLFHAYEIAGRDLRHVDLVTLSACETALGRFDALDNLRGFSANLFLAGVRTVVSTLWPVPDDVSHLFFTSMYRALHASNGKVAAFEAALRATRSEFPKYRDWGTFHFGGLW